MILFSTAFLELLLTKLSPLLSVVVVMVARFETVDIFPDCPGMEEGVRS